MKIGIGSDHGGFELKEDIKVYLQEAFPQHEVVDVGTYDTNSTNYGIYGAKVARAVAQGDVERGIVICGSGLGITMTAGKVRGIRAALCHDEYTARMSRLHNNANVLGMGGRILGKDLARSMVKIWLETEFEGGRHEQRIEQIESLTQ